MLSVKSDKQAHAPIWSGDHTRKNEKIALTCIQMLFQDTTIVICAHGTTNVQCHWHLQSSVPLALEKVQCPWLY